MQPSTLNLLAPCPTVDGWPRAARRLSSPIAPRLEVCILAGPGQLATIRAAIDLTAPGDVVCVDTGASPTFHVG